MQADIKNLSEEEIFAEVLKLIAPFNKKNIAITRDTSFSSDLDLDSLAVMDLLAAIEDHYDITVPLNILPDLERLGQVSAAVQKIIQG
ncbi:acyl carrier protein [Govanella unica]|uniref:Acyl carrier protein n=1 Tax=Govanella unica TaxID=2975056 RepID=A0A9X3Z701_9PROT|nr:acyl carrier protein [Govania unica]MDA5193651.1 acyl carrier protein [Govania unica]